MKFSQLLRLKGGLLPSRRHHPQPLPLAHPQRSVSFRGHTKPRSAAGGSQALCSRIPSGGAGICHFSLLEKKNALNVSLKVIFKDVCNCCLVYRKERKRMDK